LKARGGALHRRFVRPLPKPTRRGRKPAKPIRTHRPAGTVRREAKASGGIDLDTWEAVIVFYEFKCALCESAPWQEQGHARALAHGGEHTIANVFPVCRPCNQAQGTRTQFPRRRHPWMEQEAES
jgi:5-methylcytosine-specific restriction endonuclease McrA